MKQELIVKSNALLQHPLYKKTTELKLFSRVVLAVRDNPERDSFTFQIKELLEKIQGGIDNYTELKQIAKGMFRVVDLNPSEKLFHLSAVFTDIFVHEEGIITFEVNKNVKPFLLDLTTSFTQYYFENIARLKSSFSIRVYELLKQYERVGNRKIDLIKLRHFLSIEKEQYLKYSNFKNKVLLVAYKELKEKTDIYFEFEEIKKGRKVDEINFIIFKNNNGSAKIEETEESNETKLTTEQEQLKNKLINNFKFSEKIANELILTVSVDQIEKNIAYTEKEFKDGKITKNFNGFLIKAIKNNYAGNVSIFEIEEKNKKEQEKKKLILDEKRETLIAKLSKDFGTQERKKFVESLTEDQQQQLINDILKEVELDAYTTGLVKKKGLNTPAIYLFINKRIEGFAENREVFITEGLKKAGL